MLADMPELEGVGGEGPPPHLTAPASPTPKASPKVSAVLHALSFPVVLMENCSFQLLYLLLKKSRGSPKFRFFI